MDNETGQFQSKREENKKEDKKAFWPFLLLLVLSMLVGYFSGDFMLSFEKHLNRITNTNLLEALHNAQLSITVYAGYATLIVVVLLNLIGFILLAYCRKYDKAHPGRNDEDYTKLDHLLSVTLLLTSLENILSWALYGMGFYGISFRNAGTKDALSILLCLIGFILSLICNTILQQKTINFTKELNPEKKGSVYDMKFQKKWLASCDEAEQYLIYKCSYKAYQATTITCLILVIILALAGMILPIGFLPLLCVCLIWGVQTIVYVITSMKITSL